MSFNTTFKSYEELIEYLKTADRQQCFTINYLHESNEYNLHIGNQPYETYEEIIEDLHGQISWHLHWGSEQQKEIEKLKAEYRILQDESEKLLNYAEESKEKVKELDEINTVIKHYNMMYLDEMVSYRKYKLAIQKILRYYNEEDDGDMDIYVYACAKEAMGER